MKLLHTHCGTDYNVLLPGRLTQVVYLYREVVYVHTHKITRTTFTLVYNFLELTATFKPNVLVLYLHAVKHYLLSRTTNMFTYYYPTQH